MDLINTRTILWICWIVISFSCITTALKDVYVQVPSAVKKGDNAILSCYYDLEKDSLYSIKWYKGKREFYRYTPREVLPIKVFAVGGIIVEKELSNASSVMLKAVETTMSGKYSCEVSADAPTFHTVIVSADLEVVDAPTTGPSIEGLHQNMYKMGDAISGNCTLTRTKPAANLTWLINNYKVLTSEQLIQYPVKKELLLNLETAVLGLKLVLGSKYFQKRRIQIACRAQIYQIYDRITERIIELDVSTTHSTMSARNEIVIMNTNNNFNTDNNNNLLGDNMANRNFQMSASSSAGAAGYVDETNFDEPYDVFMHHIQADISSSASSFSSNGSLKRIFQIFSAERLNFITKFFNSDFIDLNS